MPTDSDAPGQEPNLELPSFGFGRKKKAKKADGPAVAATDDAAPAEPAAPQASQDNTPDASEDTAILPAADPVDAPTSTPRAPSAPPAPARAPGDTPVPPRPQARPPARPAARPPSRPAATGAPGIDEPTGGYPAPAVARPAAAPLTHATEPAADSRHTDLTAPAGVDPLETAAATLDEPRPSRADRAEARSRKRAGKRAARQTREPSAPGALAARLPDVKPVYAAVVAGLLSGLAAVGLAIGASRGCEAVRDTSSCGGGLGLVATLALLTLEVLLGALILKAWRIADPVSTSFLGVGLVAIVAMLTFLDQINSVWMLLVIPLMTAVAFALSWWVTVRFIDDYDANHPAGEKVRAATAEKDRQQEQDSRA